MSEVRQPAQGMIVARVSPSVLLVVLHRMLSCFVKASTSARTASVKREASRMRLQEAVLEPHGQHNIGGDDRRLYGHNRSVYSAVVLIALSTLRASFSWDPSRLEKIHGLVMNDG